MEKSLDSQLVLCDKEAAVEYILKLFDTPLLKFSVNRTIDGPQIRITWHDLEKVHLLPLSMECTSDSLRHWLRHRTIPANRAYVQNFLSKLGLSEKDFMGILDVGRGLSLNDSYWVVPVGFEGTFAEYNLFDNPFSKMLSWIAFTGYGSTPKRSFRSSPEFTTNGMLPKAWRRINGEIRLYKGGTSGFSNTGKEPYSEYYAAQVAQAMGLDAVSYGLARWKGQLCSTCRLFTSKSVSYLPAGALIRENGLTPVVCMYEEKGQSSFLADMLLFDAVIRNTDRHLGNFGFLVDSCTNKVIAPAPLFDHGLSLFCYVMDGDLENLEAQAKALTPALYAVFDDGARLLMGPIQRERLHKLLRFQFKRHPSYNLPQARLAALERFIQTKASELLRS